MLHTLGAEHRDMTSRQMLRDPEPWSVPDWAQTGPIRFEAKPAPVRLPAEPAAVMAKRAATRLATAVAKLPAAMVRLATWERKAKLAQRHVKDWAAKVTKYERTIEAAEAQAVQENES